MTRSRDQHADSPGSPEEPDTEKPEEEERPSATRVIGSALAAMTGTALLSLFGVGGTIIGAALSSVITVLGGFFYRTSLQRTADKVSTIKPPLPRKDGAATALEEPRPDDGPTGQADVAGEGDTEARLRAAGADPGADDTGGPSAEAEEWREPEKVDEAEGFPARLRASWDAAVERFGKGKLIGSIVGVFVLIMAVVTVVELAAGKPLADVVRNEPGSGTTVFGSGTSQEDEEPAPDDGPGIDPSDIPGIDPEDTEDAPEEPEEPGEPESPEEPGPEQDDPGAPADDPGSPGPADQAPTTERAPGEQES